ncbi:integrase core domain-containing protein [Saccharothrix sp. AJ9571]|nr:integrase core domain-containing protein [Saccharothrix sp. AJ9571]
MTRPGDDESSSSNRSSVGASDARCLSRAWTSEQHRTTAPAIWNIHYNYRRPHTAAGDQPPASRLHAGVTNVMASYTRCGRAGGH